MQTEGGGSTLLILLLALIYILSPIDIVPDVIPVAGWLDDVIVALVAVLWRSALEANEKGGPMSKAGTAAVLSLVIPGAGQIYNGDFLRGVFWLIVTPGLWIGSGGTLGWVCHGISAYTAYYRADICMSTAGLYLPTAKKNCMSGESSSPLPAHASTNFGSPYTQNNRTPQPKTLALKIHIAARR